MSDKKTIVNDLYQVAVISVFVTGYSMLGKNILKIAPPRHLEVQSGRHNKASCYHQCIKDDTRVSHQTEDPIRTHRSLGLHKHSTKSAALNMVNAVMWIGGALANALAFTGSSYLFSRLSKDSINKEKKDTTW